MTLYRLYPSTVTQYRQYTSDHLQYIGPQAYAGMSRHTTLMLPGGLRGWTSSRKHETVQATQQVTVHRFVCCSCCVACSRVLAIAHTGYGQYMLRFISVIGGFPDDAVSVLATTHLPRIMY